MKCRTNRRVQLHKRHQVFIGVRNETPSIVAVRVSNEDYRISVAAGADRGHVNEQRETRAPFDYAASGSSRIRFRADLASHSRAFCRNSAALCSASFSLMRIWCVSMVLTLTCNSVANSETLTPLPINEKISKSRSLRLLTSECGRSCRVKAGEYFRTKRKFRIATARLDLLKRYQREKESPSSRGR